MLQHLSSIEQPQVTYSKPHTLLRYQTSLAPEALQATKKDVYIRGILDSRQLYTLRLLASYLHSTTEQSTSDSLYYSEL